MTKEQFENNTNLKMTYEELTYKEFQKYDCIHFDKKDFFIVRVIGSSLKCIHPSALSKASVLLSHVRTMRKQKDFVETERKLEINIYVHMDAL